MVSKERTERLTLSESISRALGELQEALQSQHMSDFVASRIRRAVLLLKGGRVP